MAAQDNVARVLGPDWRAMNYGRATARARQLEAAASFARTLSAYMLETNTRTAGEALAKLRTARADAEE